MIIKFFLSLILIVLNIVNIPLTILFTKVKDWYLPMWHKDRVIYFAFAPFYWILTVITVIFAYPCEKLPALIH